MIIKAEVKAFNRSTREGIRVDVTAVKWGAESKVNLRLVLSKVFRSI